jgi:hydroxymethylglutaryl-CoA lyase
MPDPSGTATPGRVTQLVELVRPRIGERPLGAHFHNTRGSGLASSWAAVSAGVTRLDSSIGGLGGCPFAPGATGNLATEDLVYFLHGMGLRTGIDLEKLCATSVEFSRRIGRPLSSRAVQAYFSQCERQAASVLLP